MTQQELLDMWDVDSEISRNQLDETTVKTSMLHAKYLRLLTEAKLILQNRINKHDILRKDKWLYYTGKMTKQEMDDRGWDYDPFKGGVKPLKSDLDYFYDSDPDIINSKNKIEVAKVNKEILEEIMNAIRWRHNSIANIIKWKQFEAGM